MCFWLQRWHLGFTNESHNLLSSLSLACTHVLYWNKVTETFRRMFDALITTGSDISDRKSLSFENAK